MNSELLTFWLRAMLEAMPRGGKTQAAEMLGISPSGLSKILNNPHRAFDEKTCRALAWLQNSKAERYSVDQFPIKLDEDNKPMETEHGPIIVEERVNPAGGTFFVWRKG